MAYCNKSELHHYLSNFTEADAPVKAVSCAFASDAGAGMGLALFSLLVFAPVGIALTIKTQHPAPVTVTGILSAGVVTLALPGLAAKILWLVLFFGLSGLGLWLYQRSKTAL